MRAAKPQKAITPFRLLFLLPLILFIVTTILGEGLRLYRLAEERSMYSSKPVLDRLVEDFNMESMFHKYGYDFRNRMNQEERNVTGTIKDNPMERTIPKIFFVLTISSYPIYSFFKLLKDMSEQSKV
ncbi:hypothetical protein AB3N61_04480 [Leptospira sp. WS58.C1]|jgi:hypothetical protein|uniref:hypothetical protein n=1 Tax=Leptospira cinconiae TaxID=3235173 RepID=UPI00349ED7BF